MARKSNNLSLDTLWVPLTTGGETQESLDVEEVAGSQESPEAVEAHPFAVQSRSVRFSQVVAGRQIAFEAEPAPERATPDLGEGKGMANRHGV